MPKVQVVNIKEAFAKGLIDGHGKNKVPANFASYSRNHRVENGATTVKKGYSTVISSSIGTYIRALSGNSNTGKLVCATNGNLYNVNLTTSTLDLIGSLGGDKDINIFNHGKYSICLTGDNLFYVYDGTTLVKKTEYSPAYVTSQTVVIAPSDIASWKAITNGEFAMTIDGTARNFTGISFAAITTVADIASTIQTKIRAVTGGNETVTVANVFGSTVHRQFVIKSANTTSISAITVASKVSGGTGTDISGETIANVYNLGMKTGTVTNASLIGLPQAAPIIGVPFSGFTVLAGNTTDTANYIYFSRPVTPANPEYAFDWTGTGSEKRNMQSKVLALASGLNQLYIFTEETVEYVDKNSLASIGGTFSFYSSPIGKGDKILNRNCVGVANDKAFYITKDFTVKTLNYVQGTIDPAIGQLSDRALLSIKNFLTTQLATWDKQTDAYVKAKDDKVYIGLKSANSVVNDITLVYDITNDNWYVDDDGYFSCITSFNNNLYGGSMLNSNIVQFDTGYDTDGAGIPFEYWTVNMNLGSPLQRKLFKGWQISGEINFECNLTVETIIDGFSIASSTIKGSDYTSPVNEGLGSDPVAGNSVGGGDDTPNDGMVSFDAVSRQGQINIKGKQIQLRITSNNPSARFYLDYLAIMVKPIGNYQLQDVL